VALTLADLLNKNSQNAIQPTFEKLKFEVRGEENEEPLEEGGTTALKHYTVSLKLSISDPHYQ
jgi:hypothetical protein